MDASDENKIVVLGKRQDGLLDFLKHYASMRAKRGHYVQIKVLSDDLYSNFIEFCQDIRYSVLKIMGLKDDIWIEWVLVIKR